MSITWRTSSTDLLDEFEFNRVKEAAAIFKLQDCVAIDSYEMSPDGPILSSVFLLNDDFIAEVRVDAKELNCDIAPIKSACNIRIRKMSVPSRVTEDVGGDSLEGELGAINNTSQNINFVEIKIKHYNDLVSNMSFFGERLDEWLEFALSTHLSKKVWI